MMLTVEYLTGLLSQIDSLTKERDKFKAAYYSAEKCASDLSRGCAKLQTERDALIADVARLSDRQKSFEKGVTDAGIYLKAERDALTAAAKLALDALHAVLHDCDDIDTVESNEPGRDVGTWQLSNDAITALRQAGVQ